MSKKRKQLGGIVPATITPFTADEKINGEAMLQLMKWNMGQGVDSFFVGGSSAECFLLSPEERKEIFAIASLLEAHSILCILIIRKFMIHIKRNNWRKHWICK